MNLHEKQIQKLEQYVAKINTDQSQTLKHKIETINLKLTGQKVSSNTSTIVINNMFSINLLSSSEPNKDSTISAMSSSDSKINYDEIDMLLIELRKYLAHYVLNWNTKMSEFFKKSKFDEVTSHYLLILLSFKCFIKDWYIRMIRLLVLPITIHIHRIQSTYRNLEIPTTLKITAQVTYISNLYFITKLDK